jgi:PAS domain S-box-containing protein
LGADGEYVTVIDQLRVLERDPKNGTAIRLVGSLFNPVQRQQVEDILHGSRTDFLRGLQQPRTKNSDNDSAHLLKIVTDNSASGLFMMDRQGHPTFMNQAACDITGWTLDEISHQPLHYSIHNRKPDGSHYPMEECPLDNSAAELVPLKDQHEIFNHRSGRLFPVVFSVAPLSSRGRTVGAVIEFRDVTHERKTEEDKLKLLVQAEAERTKMAASQLSQQKLAQFVDYICHEIRNPLHGKSSGS